MIENQVIIKFHIVDLEKTIKKLSFCSLTFLGILAMLRQAFGRILKILFYLLRFVGAANSFNVFFYYANTKEGRYIFKAKPNNIFSKILIKKVKSK